MAMFHCTVSRFPYSIRTQKTSQFPTADSSINVLRYNLGPPLTGVTAVSYTHLVSPVQISNFVRLSLAPHASYHFQSLHRRTEDVYKRQMNE